MENNDTVRLLRECDSGVKMGMDSINQVLPSVRSEDMKSYLEHSHSAHEDLDRRIQSMLEEVGDDGKTPNPIVKGMSWMKTEMKLTMDKSDATVAELMTDGCNMGIKSLSRYLNQYKAADLDARDVTKRLIEVEDELARNMRDFL